MKYIKPTYNAEIVETGDILLTSTIDLGNGVTLTKTPEGNAQIGASAYDVLGINR